MTDEGGHPAEWAAYMPPGSTPPQVLEPLPPQPGSPDEPLGHVVRRSPNRFVAGLVGVAMLAGGTVFAISAFGDSGPQSPEAAVQAMFDAIEDEDLIGALELLPDGERRALQTPLQDLAGELTRLGVFDETLDLQSIDGFDFDFEGLRYEIEELAPGITAVRVIDGTVTSRVLPGEVPLGSAIDEIEARFREREQEDCEAYSDPTFDCTLEFENIDEIAPTSETVSLTEGDEIELVAIEDGGGWRVSIGYTVAELARQDADLPLPFFDTPTPAGAESPEEAVRGVVERALDLDAAGVLTYLPPDELAALHDYAPLFLPEIEASAVESRDDTDLVLTDLELEAQPVDGGALVLVKSFAIEGTMDGEPGSVTWDGECITVVGEASPEEDFDSCDGGPGFLTGTGGAEVEPMPVELGEVETGIMTVEVGGRWYLSPTRTVLGGVAAFLRAIPDDGLADLIDWYFEMLFAPAGDLMIEGDLALPEEGTTTDELTFPPMAPDGPMEDTRFCRRAAASSSLIMQGSYALPGDHERHSAAVYDAIDPPPVIEARWGAMVDALDHVADVAASLDLPDDPEVAWEAAWEVDAFYDSIVDAGRTRRSVDRFVRDQCGIFLL